MDRPTHSGECIYEESVSADFRAADLDLKALRESFIGPFENAALALQKAGFEQDDGIIERWLICCLPDGTEHRIEALWLADRDRLLMHVSEQLSSSGRTPPLRDVQVTSLEVRALLHRG